MPCLGYIGKRNYRQEKKNYLSLLKGGGEGGGCSTPRLAQGLNCSTTSKSKCHGRGRMLTALCAFFFKVLPNLPENHYISDDNVIIEHMDA